MSKTAISRILPVLCLFVVICLATAPVEGKVTEKTAGSFTVVQEVILPETPEAVFDATTGDISGWWDHHFSEKPARFCIEPKPGGGFYEIFDESGDGVLHATVIGARRGKLLRMNGPLGFAGHAALFVWTLTYEPVELDESGKTGTKLTMTGKVSGAIEEGWAEAVDSVWHHFLVEGLKPYIEKGLHRK